MVEERAIVKCSVGLHARPASAIVHVAKSCISSVKIKKNDVEVNARSILRILTLEAGCGEEVTVSVTGPDEKEVLEKICGIITATDEELDKCLPE